MDNFSLCEKNLIVTLVEDLKKEVATMVETTETISGIYFAHPVNTYGQPIEAAVITLIQHCFPGRMIENPNQPHHQEGYERWKRETEESRDVHNAMQYFFKVVLPKLYCVAMPFLDGRIGIGVAGETKKVLQYGNQAWFAAPTHVPTSEEIDAFVKNPLNGLFRIRPFTPSEVALLNAEVPEPVSNEVVDAKLVVQHQETRLRTFYIYNQDRRPYAESHLVTMPIPSGFYPEVKK